MGVHTRDPRSSFTFAVIGRDEAPRLAGMVRLAQAAVGPGDQVWFVDSASRDDSIAVARGLGVEVIEAPAGKGRAMAVAIDRCESDYVCFLDADLFEWTVDIPATLRQAAVTTGADMVVGMFIDDRRRVIQPNLYWPLVDALFPDCGRLCDPTPISGMRVIDPALVSGPLPPGYGAETHLNLTFGMAGHRIEAIDLGFLRGPLRGYSNIPESGRAVATAILDVAVAAGRLDPRSRSEWDGWVEGVLDAIGVPPPPGAPDADHLAAVRAAAACPLPPSGRPDPITQC